MANSIFRMETIPGGWKPFQVDEKFSPRVRTVVLKDGGLRTGWKIATPRWKIVPHGWKGSQAQ